MDSYEIHRLISDKAQESLYLEFKRGEALSRESKAKSEFIKDVTGFANADGGRIIYGISEKKIDGISRAEEWALSIPAEIDKEWISSVIRDNTSPRLHDFDVYEFPINGSRVIVVAIRAGRTAHQNLLDYKYYQRTGVVTSAINDFQIRDLMSRTTKPLAEVITKFNRIKQSREFHRYLFLISIKNIGSVTMEKWSLEIDIPHEVLIDSRISQFDQMQYHDAFRKIARKFDHDDGHTYWRVCLRDPFIDGERYILHPGQSHGFTSAQSGIPELVIEINNESYRCVKDMPLHWTLYLNNSPPIHGKIPFDTWCNF